MRSSFLRGLLLFIPILLLSAIEVDEEELRSSLGQALEFQNYSGPVQRFETAEQIRSIGADLARNMPSDQDGQLQPGQAVYAQRYRVTRIPPRPEEALRGADILELLPDAAVDHVDNLRRIIGAYLESAFAYSRADANTLAQLVTLYNAVHRSAIPDLQQAYNAQVMAALIPEKAGLSLNYRDWAGGSQILIPLIASALPGQVSSIPADVLASPEVVESLRTAEDQSLELRQDVADLIDRSVEAERDLIAQEEENLAQEEARLAAERMKREQEQSRLQAELEAAERERSRVQEELAQAAAREDQQRTEELQEELVQIDSAQQELEEELRETQAQEEAAGIQEAEIERQREVLDAREEQASQAQERADEIREELAEDIREQTAAGLPALPLIYASTRIEDGILLSRLMLIDGRSAQSLNRESNVEIVGRQAMELASSLLAVVPETSAGPGRLALLNPSDLSVIRQSEVQVFSQTDLVYDSGSSILYAVVSRDGDWYLGAFDQNLNALRSSIVAVRPETSILLADNSLLVSRKDGRIVRLSRTDLRVE